MAIENANEVKEWLGKEENKDFLSKNGFQTEIEVEKKVEIPASLSDEVVTKYIEDNQSYRDKLNNDIQTDFLKKKTGKEEIKPEDLGKKLFFENDVNTQSEKYKNALIKAHMAGVKNPELLITQIESDKVTFNDGKLEGFEDQLKTLKEKYPDQFAADTPPNTKKHLKDDKKLVIKKTREELDAMTMDERMKYKKENPEWHKNL